MGYLQKEGLRPNPEAPKTILGRNSTYKLRTKTMELPKLRTYKVWALTSNGETAAHFLFNQIITRFGISKELVTNHGSHFQNRMMEELASKLGYKKEHSSYYYP